MELISINCLILAKLEFPGLTRPVQPKEDYQLGRVLAGLIPDVLWPANLMKIRLENHGHGDTATNPMEIDIGIIIFVLKGPFQHVLYSLGVLWG